MKLVRVKRVVPLEEYRARIFFDNGERRIIDLEKYLHGPVFRAVRLRKMFVRMRVGEGRTIEWPNGADICPDVLYYGGPPPWALKFIEREEKRSKNGDKTRSLRRRDRRSLQDAGGPASGEDPEGR